MWMNKIMRARVTKNAMGTPVLRVLNNVELPGYWCKDWAKNTSSIHSANHIPKTKGTGSMALSWSLISHDRRLINAHHTHLHFNISYYNNSYTTQTGENRPTSSKEKACAWARRYLSAPAVVVLVAVVGVVLLRRENRWASSAQRVGQRKNTGR